MAAQHVEEGVDTEPCGSIDENCGLGVDMFIGAQLRVEYLKGILLEWLAQTATDDPQGRSRGKVARDSEAAQQQSL